jgi:hypothetical protein
MYNYGEVHTGTCSERELMAIFSRNIARPILDTLRVRIISNS